MTIQEMKLLFCVHEHGSILLNRALESEQTILLFFIEEGLAVFLKHKEPEHKAVKLTELGKAAVYQLQNLPIPQKKTVFLDQLGMVIE